MKNIVQKFDVFDPWIPLLRFIPPESQPFKVVVTAPKYSYFLDLASRYVKSGLGWFNKAHFFDCVYWTCYKTTNLYSAGLIRIYYLGDEIYLQAIEWYQQMMQENLGAIVEAEKRYHESKEMLKNLLFCCRMSKYDNIWVKRLYKFIQNNHWRSKYNSITENIYNKYRKQIEEDYYPVGFCRYCRRTIFNTDKIAGHHLLNVMFHSKCVPKAMLKAM